MKPRTPIRRISEKKLAKLGGRVPFSTIAKKPGKALKRTALPKARKPLPRSTKPLKRTRIKPVGKRGSRFWKRRNKPFTDWVATLECLLADYPGTSCWHPEDMLAKGRHSDPAHVLGTTRGAGAYDEGEVAPLCRSHHAEQEGKTEAFARRYRLNLKVAAEQTWALYETRVLGKVL